MRKLLRRSALVLLCAALGACASDGGEGHSPDGRPQHPLPNVFISPAGQPFRAARDAPYAVAVWFALADANHDARLSRSEFIDNGLAFFNRLDTNHDGVIDGLELQDYEQNIAPEILPHIDSLHADEGTDPNLTFGDPNNTDNRPVSSPHRRGDGSRESTPRGIGVQGAAIYSLINAPEPVAAADLQFDGRITRTEFTTALEQRFDILDTVKAGYLTLSGLPKTPLQAEIIKRKVQEQRRLHAAYKP